MGNIVNLNERRSQKSVIRLGNNATSYTETAINFLQEYWLNEGISIPSSKVMKEAQSRHNFTFVVVTQEPGQIIRAIVEHYALKRRSMKALLSGEINEENIRTDDLLEVDSPLEKGLYVAITCPEFESINYAKYVLAAIYGSVTTLNSYLREHKDLKSIDLWAINSTSDGLRLMTNDYIKFKLHEAFSQKRSNNGCRERAWVRRYKLSKKDIRRQANWKATLDHFNIVAD